MGHSFFFAVRITITWFLLLQFSNNFAQNSVRAKIDSLMPLLDQKTSSYDKANLYNSLVELYSEISSDSAKIYFGKSILEINAGKEKVVLEKDLKDLETLEGKALFCFGTLNYALSRFDTALYFYKQAILLQEKTNDKQGVCNTLNYMSRIYERQGDSRTFYNMTNRALSLQRELNDLNGSALSLIALANYYERIGANDSCHLYYKKALDILSKTKDPVRLASCLRDQGFFFERQGRLKEALLNYLDALKIQEDHNYSYESCRTLMGIASLFLSQGDLRRAAEFNTKANNKNKLVNSQASQAKIQRIFGDIFSGQDEHEKALEYYSGSLKITIESNLGPMMESIALSRIGILYKNSGGYTKAKDYLSRALVVGKDHSLPIDRSKTLIALGEVSFLTGDLNTSENYILQALAEGEKNKLVNIIQKANYNLFQIFNERKNYKRAIDYYKVYSSLKDTLNKEFLEKLLIEKDAEYKLLNKDKELILEKQKIALLKKDRKLKNLLLIGLTISFVLLIATSIFGYLFFANRRREEKAKTQRYFQHINFLQDRVKLLLSEENVKLTTVSDERINDFLQNPLSPRELEVLEQLCKGKSNQEIADSIFVSINTVRAHLQKIYEKLDVKNRMQAVKKASSFKVD